MVEQAQERSGWSMHRALSVLGMPRSTYHRWRRRSSTGGSSSGPRRSLGCLFELLLAEKRAIREYALSHPELRHRELSWRMVDEGICFAWASSVYRVLREAGLMCGWRPKPKAKGAGRSAPSSVADAQWQTDIKYVQGRRGHYYLLSFLDVYSRYVVHHRLLRRMDGRTVSIEAAAALETLDGRRTPDIQSDHGAGFISREFAETLSAFGVTHKKIRPHTPTDNAETEWFHRTLEENLDETEAASDQDFVETAERIIDRYNRQRLHSVLGFLRPVDFYRGNPEPLR